MSAISGSGSGSVQLHFNATLAPTVSATGQLQPVLIVGQHSHLASLPYTLLAPHLEQCVSAATWQLGVRSLQHADACPLHLQVATVASLPAQVSRHNSHSRGLALSRQVRSHAGSVAMAQAVPAANGGGRSIAVIVVCERRDMYASGCAVARAYPEYSSKSTVPPAPDAADESSCAGGSTGPVTVNVHFILMDGKTGNDEEVGLDAQQSLSAAELAALHDATFGIRLAARIVDAPCNEMNVRRLVAEARAVAAALAHCGVAEPLVLGAAELRARGFGGLYGVGRAAMDAAPDDDLAGAALVVLSWRPPTEKEAVKEEDELTEGGPEETVAWVGKGIVYDTGGLSIKGKTAMPGMKRDCGGAAAVLGAFYAAVRGGFGRPLHAVLCCAENAVGPNATRPDDIHRLYSGRTVEINNTDAEGRLVLADGVAYARRDLHATIVLDMATLTGAQGVATGKYHGAVLTNNADWERRALRAGRTSGDLLAPLVYAPDLHFAEYVSSVADMKNSVADRNNALASCAGLFVAAHLGFDFAGTWLHVDMAYPVSAGERATGYGVALLCTLFGRFMKNSLLRKIGPELRTG